jgi:hypothetical protein
VTTCALASGGVSGAVGLTTSDGVYKRTGRRASSGQRSSGALQPACARTTRSGRQRTPRRGHERLRAHRVCARQATSRRVSCRRTAQAHGLVQRRFLHVRLELRPRHPAFLVAAHSTAPAPTCQRITQRGQRACAARAVTHLSAQGDSGSAARAQSTPNGPTAVTRRRRNRVARGVARAGTQRSEGWPAPRMCVTSMDGRTAAWLQLGA